MFHADVFHHGSKAWLVTRASRASRRDPGALLDSTSRGFLCTRDEWICRLGTQKLQPRYKSELGVERRVSFRN